MLLDPRGPLLRTVPSIAIPSANGEMRHVFEGTQPMNGLTVIHDPQRLFPLNLCARSIDKMCVLSTIMV